MMNYWQIQAALEKLDTDIEPAEAHGMAAAMLCIAENTDAQSWLNELCNDETSADADSMTLLQKLFAQTQQALSEPSAFEFDLLLPDDETPLYENAEALRSWCEGFLYGIGYSRHGAADWPGDSSEIIGDLVAFSQMDSDAATEDDDEALTEIREYLRAAVFILKDSLATATEAQTH